VIWLARDLLARSRVALGWWALGLLAMGAYVVLVFDSIGSLEDLRRLYEGYPQAIRELIGDVDISTLNGWIQAELMSWVPLVLAIYAGIFAAGSISREVEQRTVDFVLGLPLSRSGFIGSRLLVGMVNMALICLATFVLLLVMVAVVGHTPDADRYALALANAFVLASALFCGYVLIATFVDEQARVTGITLGITLVMYIATAALKAAGAPDVVRWLMPFEHYHAAEAMSRGTLPVLPMVALAVAGVLAGTAAVYWYNRRDIAI
jgi:ABC-type transport system involved in multi-copper enzyme maturation permease subunit